MNKISVAALVSGGVDSSVGLALLKKQGYQLTAFYLKIWLEDELSYLGDCPWQEDLLYVQKVCEQLKVPLEVVPLQREYHDRIVSYVLDELKRGRTPNPDVMCNKQIKFGAFLEYIEKSGKNFDKIATGHYAQVKEIDGQAHLFCSPDEIKDQTYFLSHLSLQQLNKLIFPIGHLQKHQVRELAHEFDLANKDRKDSQGICFLGKIKFRDFIKHHCGEKQGPFIEVETGQKMGEHNGFWFYTIGQRQGLRLAGGPWYVVAKTPETNTVFISRNYYGEDKARDNLRVGNLCWFSSEEIPQKCTIKLRHGAHKHECTIEWDIDRKSIFVRLNSRDQGIAAGQVAAFYVGSECIGSGIIE